jgi:hypothetical protein
MEKMYKYTVAGHTFGVLLPDYLLQEDHLKPYIPFTASEDADPLFTLTLKSAESLRELNPGKVKECLNDEAPYFWIFENGEDRYSFGFSYTKVHPDCLLHTSDDLKSNVIYVAEAGAAHLAEFALSNAMMLLYTFCTSPYDTLLVHASVIAHAGGGYMFLGRSGTGKSTHSRLWLNNIEDTYLLNDDNPIIRFIDGEAYVYGSPWSGKTHCYKAERYELRGCVRISQAPANSIKKLPLLRAYGSIHPSCPPDFAYDNHLYDHVSRIIGKILTAAQFYHLECLPDKAAALLSCKTIFHDKQ